jgi:hypothetical protein
MNNRQEYYRKYYQDHKEQIRKQQETYRQMVNETPTYEPKLDLYYTREELKEAEERGEGKINWEAWDSLIEKGKQELKEWEIEQQEKKRHTNNRKALLRSLYNTDGQLILRASAKEIAAFLEPYFSMRWENVTSYCLQQRIKDGFYFDYKRYHTVEEAKKAITKAKMKSKKWR